MKVRVEKQIGGKTFAMETGLLAKQAAGSCLVQCADTVVLAAVASGPPRPGIDPMRRKPQRPPPPTLQPPLLAPLGRQDVRTDQGHAQLMVMPPDGCARRGGPTYVS